ncbi:hypothetical protein P8452_03081 [Trifolium repens]|nr:hypothetical protein P8452_03081 [Trifolium repens]
MHESLWNTYLFSCLIDGKGTTPSSLSNSIITVELAHLSRFLSLWLKRKQGFIPTRTHKGAKSNEKKKVYIS